MEILNEIYGEEISANEPPWHTGIWEKIDQFFDALSRNRVLALHCFGCCRTCADKAIFEIYRELRKHDEKKYIGYLTYNWNDAGIEDFKDVGEENNVAKNVDRVNMSYGYFDFGYCGKLRAKHIKHSGYKISNMFVEYMAKLLPDTLTIKQNSNMSDLTVCEIDKKQT